MVPRHAVTQKGSLPWPINRAFALVDRELEPFRKESGDRSHYPFAAGFSCNVDVAVVSETTERVTSFFQFLVEFVQ